MKENKSYKNFVNYPVNNNDIFNQAALAKEEEILELHRQYTEMKKERMKSQNDFNYLTNKMGLLQTEEKKTYIKVRRLKEHESELRSIRSRVLDTKNYLETARQSSQENLKIQRDQIKIIRDEVRQVNTSWRDNIAEKASQEKQLLMKEKEKNLKHIEESRCKSLEKNRLINIKVRSEKLKGAKKIKMVEDQKKSNYILELRKKIEKEKSLHAEISSKIAGVEKNEDELIKRIQTVKLDLKFDSNHNIINIDSNKSQTSRVFSNKLILNDSKKKPIP